MSHEAIQNERDDIQIKSEEAIKNEMKILEMALIWSRGGKDFSSEDLNLTLKCRFAES